MNWNSSILDGNSFKEEYFKWFALLFAMAISTFPLLFNLPFRDNIYLSFEGALRISNGQVPFDDFYMPLGYGYFLILTLFFKLFGASLKVLLLAQAFINIVTLMVFYILVRTLNVSRGAAFLGVLTMGLSYAFLFFWPWYNNTAFFYNLLAIFFCYLAIFRSKYNLIFAGISGLAAFLSFFTKQDYGGLAILSCLFFYAIDFLYSRNFKNPLVYIAALISSALIFILPVFSEKFQYWFNLGQEPHQSRVHLSHFLDEVFAGSEIEKLIILVLGFLLLVNFKELIRDKKRMYLYLLVLVIMGETLITKVTSRLPSDTTTYFWAFFIVLFVSELLRKLNLRNAFNLAIASFLIFTLFSAKYWSYANRIFKFQKPVTAATSVSDMDKEKAKERVKWVSCNLPSFSKVSLPQATVKGIDTILKLNLPENPKVLNMSELTMLAKEIPYKPLTNVPLWYHLNIGIFDEQVDVLKANISSEEYDLVLFEEVPNIENFYPYIINDLLREKYKLVTSFPAPRKDGNSRIDVYLKK